MKTLEKVPIRVEFVEDLPSKGLERGILYLNKETLEFSHSCLCECEKTQLIPLNYLDNEGEVISSDCTRGWNMTINEGKVTITPSILNEPCNCHYIITKGIANIV